MEPFAELEIGLHRRVEGEYTVEFRFSQTGSDVDVRLGQTQPAHFALDPASLRSDTFNPPAYARQLTDCFFADPQVKELFGRACAVAEHDRLPLRVRLVIGPSAPELQSVYWEQLLDPADGSPLFTGEKIYFSRYISSLDMRPVITRPKTRLNALVFIANPANLARYELAPIDVQGEYRRAKQGLGKIPAALVAGPATLDHLIEALRAQKPAILYFVCHGGMRRDASGSATADLWLEDAAGQAAITPAAELVTRFKELEAPPQLVVLASCDSAGQASAGDARASLGPRLAEAGVPAVVAMQGSVSMATVAEFMPAFFQALRLDGHIDRAMTLARGRVRRSFDFWMPVLFTRLNSGLLFVKPNLRLQIAAAAVGLLLLALLGGGYWWTTRPNPMGTGYNIAIAEFTVQDEQGHLSANEEGLSVSRALYNSILNTLKDLPPTRAYDTRGPDKIGPVPGDDPAARDTNAKKIAATWNARILIYGVITRAAGGGYQIQPSYTISDPDFKFSAEIIGADRLGQPVPVDLQQDLQKNDRLYARVRVLENVVKGLSGLFTEDYVSAGDDFEKAIAFFAPNETSGEEVVQVLLGSARLRSYTTLDKDPARLALAREAFEQAQALNPKYARAYLGLGSAAAAEADLLRVNNAPTAALEAKLFEAQDWIKTAAEMPDQPQLGYLPLKSAYELGQIYLIGAAAASPHFTLAQAEASFNQALEEYKQAGRPRELAWYSAHTYYDLGQLTGLRKDWPTMGQNCTRAAADLDQLNQESKYVARDKARIEICIGTAAVQQKKPEEAASAFCKALAIGKPYVSADEVQYWNTLITNLGKGAPQNVCH